eukprot:scaffold126837_cov18-Prasinocladus_malaysianus.AAC.1
MTAMLPHASIAPSFCRSSSRRALLLQPKTASGVRRPQELLWESAALPCMMDPGTPYPTRGLARADYVCLHHEYEYTIRAFIAKYF